VKSLVEQNMRSPVSFTNVPAPFGHKHWKFVANALTPFLRKKNSEKWG